MLISLAIWFYIFVICVIFGSFFLRLISKFTSSLLDFPPLPLITLAGLVIVTSLASFFSLVTKIGVFFQIFLLSGTLALILLKQPNPSSINIKRNKNSVLTAILLVAMLIVLENATHRPNNPDTNLYHAQAIRWIESYPAVPGLGNLHGRLAYNSAWFISNAIFSFSFLNGQSFHLLSSFLFILFLWYSWEGVLSCLEFRFSAARVVKLAFFILSISLFGAEISSPGTDLPANLLVWFIIALWLDSLENNNLFYRFLIFLVTLFSITVKLSTIPILICSVIIFLDIFKQKNRMLSILFIFTGIMVLLPFFLRNIIQSGYLLYPFPAIDIFSFDWKIPLERVKEENSAIMAWGKLPHGNPEEVNSLTFIQWFSIWITRQTINRIAILLTAFTSFLFLTPEIIKKNIKSDFLLAWFASFAGLIFWLFTAPDFRFGYAFIFSSILLALSPHITRLFKKVYKFKQIVTGSMIILLTAFLLITLTRSTEWNSLQTRLIIPKDYDKVATQPCDIANFPISCAKSYNACSYFSFPCIPNPRSHVQARGKTLADGFRAIP